MIKLSEPKTPPEIDAYFEFRWRHLRAPWDMPRGSEKDELEASAMHISASTDSGALIGVGRIHLNSDDEAQIRYMATADSHRGRGVGTAIVARLEQLAKEHGATRVIINARENALPFYQKLGYKVFRGSPTLIGTIAHKLMQKRL